MTRDVSVLEIGQTVTDARRRIEKISTDRVPARRRRPSLRRHRARTDLLGPDADPDTPLAAIASTDVVTLTPDDTLVTTLERIVDEEVEHLPVIDDDRRIVGMCTRTDILRARSRHLTAEQAQQGWHAAWRRKRAESNGSD